MRTERTTEMFRPLATSRVHAPEPRHSLRLASVLMIAALLALALTARSAIPAAAALATVDFGTVNVGDTVSLDQELPLQYSLSQIPADTVVYSGGNPTIDLILAQLGLSAPLTAGQLYDAIGEVTATYHLTLQLATGTDFAVDNGDCATATLSCTAQVSFAPTAVGMLSDTVSANIADLQVSGGGQFGSLIQLIAPFLEPVVEDQLAVDLIGTGVEAASGGLELKVSVAPEAAPCLLLDAATVDFGELPFSTENQLSSGAGGVVATSCSTRSEAIYLRGTDATGNGQPPASWALSSVGGPCAAGVDQYGASLSTDIGGGPVVAQLSTTKSSWVVLAAETAASVDVGYQMPCVGSTGAGQTMTSVVTFTATAP
jgi:hypothetical protein